MAVTDNKIVFYKCLLRQYASLSSTNPSALYFIDDAKKLFLGDIDITTNLEFVQSWNLEFIVDERFYINSNTGEVRVHRGDNWITVVPPISSSLSDFSDPDKQSYLANIACIKEYVEQSIESGISSDVNFVRDISYADGKMSVLKGKSSYQDIELSGVVNNPTYDPSSLKLTLPVYGSPDLVINFPKDSFVKSGRYEPNYLLPDGTHGPAIVLVVGPEGAEQEVVIPASSLVNIYKGGQTSTVSVDVSDSTNIITASIKISSKHENSLVAEDDGLFIDTSDLDNRISQLENRLTDITDDEIVIGNSDKYVSSGVVIGASTLAETPNDKTVATEAAVADAISWRIIQNI